MKQKEGKRVNEKFAFVGKRLFLPVKQEGRKQERLKIEKNVVD